MYLPPHSPFCKHVYDLIRPHIPRSEWPADSLSAVFTAGPDGRFLVVAFEGLSARFTEVAAQAVSAAGFGLVLQSPMAYSASQLYRALRWRNVCLYAIVPLLFAIPLMGAIGGTAMRAAAFLFAGDLAGFFLTHSTVLRRRAHLAEARFSADIPVPGLRIRMPSSTAERIDGPL